MNILYECRSEQGLSPIGPYYLPTVLCTGHSFSHCIENTCVQCVFDLLLQTYYPNLQTYISLKPLLERKNSTAKTASERCNMSFRSFIANCKCCGIWEVRCDNCRCRVFVKLGSAEPQDSLRGDRSSERRKCIIEEKFYWQF